MAKLVGAFAASHAPLMARAWEAVDAKRLADISATFTELRRRYDAARPDVLVMVSPDHWVNFFMNNLPSVCIGVGEQHDGPPEPWLKGVPYKTISGHPEFALHLAQCAMDTGFEPSLSYKMELDHGFVIPFWKMGLAQMPAVVPVVVNTVEPPYPSLKRCSEWGKLIRSAIDSFPGDLRVALVATGGLSHSIGEHDMGRIDEKFDLACAEHFRSSPMDTLLGFLEDNVVAAGNGTAEVRNWLAVHSAVGGKGFDLIGYHPYPEWYVGCGFASWKV